MEKEPEECCDCQHVPFDGVKCRRMVRRKECVAAQVGAVTVKERGGPVSICRSPTSDDYEAQTVERVDVIGFRHRSSCGFLTRVSLTTDMAYLQTLQRVDDHAAKPIRERPASSTVSSAQSETIAFFGAFVAAVFSNPVNAEILRRIITFIK